MSLPLSSKNCSSKSGLSESDQRLFAVTLAKSLERLQHSLIPDVCALPWITPPGAWYESPGKLSVYGPLIWKCIRNIRTDYGKHVEKRYWEKLKPRNIYLKPVLDKKLSGIMWDQGDSGVKLDWRLLVLAMQVLGLGKSKGRSSIYGVKPPKGQTSLGICKVDGVAWTGEKSEYWLTMMRIASEIDAWAQEQNFTWENIDEHWQQIIEKWALVCVPSFRLDRGWDKVRLLFMGNSPMYILETSVTAGIKDDMRACSSFGYLPKYIGENMEIWKGQQIISGDLQAMDLHCSRDSLKAAWHAWQVLYGLPEYLMTVLYAYNAYAPVALWCGDEIVYQPRIGINPSGVGAFVIIMNILMAFYRVHSVSSLTNSSYDSHSTWEFGMGFGDDHVVPLPQGVMLREWVSQMRSYGQIADDSITNIGECKFLRMLFSRDHAYEPVVFSRFRNAACPEDPAIRSRTADLTAVALRAQLLPFLMMSLDRASYRSIYELMVRWFAQPKGKHDHLLSRDGVSDEELARRLGAYSHREKDALFFAKRIYGVKETLDYFSDRV